MATQFEIDCALMAGASYISTRKPLNQFPIPSEWTEQIVERAADDTGFEATCFTKGTELVISYAGTYDSATWRSPRCPRSKRVWEDVPSGPSQWLHGAVVGVYLGFRRTDLWPGRAAALTVSAHCVRGDLPNR